jgi:hypothetical protein
VAALSSVITDCPACTGLPASTETFLIEAVIGLDNISSNSGNTSPEAFRVFSIFPISTVEVLICERFNEGSSVERSNQAAETNAATKMTEKRIIFFLLLKFTSFEITLSINRF